MEMEIIDANTLFGFWPLRRLDMSLPTLFNSIKRHGIKGTCTLSAKGIFYDFVQGNEETLQASQANEWVIPVGTVDLRKFVGYEEEIKRRREQGFKLFRFFPNYQAWSIESILFRKLLRALNDLEMPFMIPAKTFKMTKLAEVTGGFKPPIIVESSHYYDTAEILAVMEENSNIYVETHWLHGPDSIETFVEKVGVERLIFGSSAPLFYIAPALDRVLNAEITDRQKELILSKNLLKAVMAP